MSGLEEANATARSWQQAPYARCRECSAVRLVSKYRPYGLLRCRFCDKATEHVCEDPRVWHAKALWFAKLFLSAGITVTEDVLRPLAGGPSVVDVACWSRETPPRPWQDTTPVSIALTFHQGLTPWGLPRAMHAAWECLGRIDYWRPYEWGNRRRLGWLLPGRRGDVDAGAALPAGYLASLMGGDTPT